VPAGAQSPFQNVYSKPGMPASAMVGVPGSRLERCALLTPSTTTRRSRMCGSASVMVLKVKVRRPAIVSCIASAPPLYGTWTTSMPAAILNFSELKCAPLPMPAEP